MEHVVPQASGKLAQVAMTLARNPAAIVERANQALLYGDAAYAGLPPSIRIDVRESIEFAAQLWLKTVVDGHPPSEEELSTIADSGRRRVHQGVSLSSLLHAVRLGSRELWHALLEQCGSDPDSREQLLMLFSPFLLDFFDAMSLRLASAYVDEQYQRARWRDALRYELLSIIFGVPSDGAAFRRTAEALGLDPATPRVALALEVDLPEVLPSRTEGELDRIVLSVSRCLKVPANDLVRMMHRGRVVVWVPTIRGDSVLATDTLMRAYAKEIMDCTRDVRAVGIGLTNAGAAGWAASVNEAFRALDSSHRTGAASAVASYSDFVLDESVLRSENALRYLEALIDRISHEQDLLQTLTVFFERGQHRKRASERLGIHPNTLNYRLGRIEDILGANLGDIKWMAKLHVAIQLRQSSDHASTAELP
jgi:sugar diacid utilization regulator